MNKGISLLINLFYRCLILTFCVVCGHILTVLMNVMVPHSIMRVLYGSAWIMFTIWGLSGRHTSIEMLLWSPDVTAVPV